MDCIDLFKRAAMALQTDPRYVILDQARKANDKDEEHPRQYRHSITTIRAV